MKKNPITNTDPMNTAHAAAYIAIRARHQASGLDLMRRLNQTQHADRIREDLPRIAAEAMEARKAHDMHREAADTLQAIADRVSTPTAQAEAAAIAAAEHRTAAARELDHAERLERVISTTSHSDRADISQAAALAYLAFTAEHSADEYETAEDYSREAFAAACKAAGKAIGAVAAAHGCTATRTKVEPISAEEAAAIMDAYPNAERIPFNVREGMTAGYITIEHRDSKRFPAGWYKVKHYHTAAPYISYEVFASGEASEAMTDSDNDTPAAIIDTMPQYQTNGGINAITDAGDAERINALFDRAKLSERERIVCRYMTDNTAAAAGIKAVEQHQAQTAERVKAAETPAQAKRIQREADKQTEEIRSKAQRENAMRRAGIYSAEAQRQFLHRIRTKLEKAKSAPTERPTAAELDRRMWERLQANRDRYSRDRATAVHVADIVPTVTAYTDRNAKPTEYADYTPVFVERINRAALRPVVDATAIVKAATITPDRPTASDYDHMWRMLDHINDTAAAMPREERYAAILAKRMQEAQEAAQKAQEAADSYSATNHSDPARKARIAAVKAQEAAQNARRKYTEQTNHIDYMRRFITANMHSRRDF